MRGHKCAQLFYLESPNYIVEVPEDAEQPLSAQPFDPDAPMISLSAITGIQSKDTMQLRVQIGAHEFTALLDSGSTHNFISVPASQHANLPFVDSGGAHVVVPNGDRIPCRGLAHDVKLRIGDDSFMVDCFSIPLDCHDIVLGIAWL